MPGKEAQFQPVARKAAPARRRVSRVGLGCLLLVLLISACQPAPTALPPFEPGYASTLAAETLQAGAPTRTLLAIITSAHLTSQAAKYSPTPSPTRPSATPEPTSTLPFSLFTLTPPTATASLTPAPILLIATADTNCRLRPQPEAERLGILQAGEEALALGQNSDASWFYIENPDQAGEYCWVWGGALVLSGESAALPVVPTATRAPLVNFEITYSNIHACAYDKFLIFRVENTGTETLYVARIAITDKKGSVLHSDILWAPYMYEANHCPPGRYALESGQRGFIYIKQISAIKANTRLRAVVKICTEEGALKKCVEKELLFQF